MAVDLGLLEVRKVIIHDVPRRDLSGVGDDPILSDVESPLTDDLSRFFRDKIVEAIGSSSAFGAVVDSNQTSPIPRLASQLLSSPTCVDFVEASQEMARHLHSCQTRVNPGGLLTVVDCASNGTPGLVILKVEREEGVRIEQRATDGGRTFDVSHIKDLLFTQKTKLFKVAMFTCGQADGSSVEVIVVDNQRGYTPTSEVALFFLQKFLGCKLQEAASVTTKRFFEKTQEFINTHIGPADLKASVYCHLVAELTSPRTMVNVDAFARNSLPTEHQQAYITFLSENGIESLTFVKETKIIKDRLRKTAIEFASGISVIGDEQTIREKVSYDELDDGTTRMTITDRLRRVGAK